MSHYLAVVLIPRDTTDIEGTVAELLAPYDENDPESPDAKWDWWQIGGRWTGAFDPAYDPRTDPANMERCWLCKGTGMYSDTIGQEQRAQGSTETCKACRGTKTSLMWPTGWKRFAGDIMPVSRLPKELDAFAVVTPDGQWHECGVMGWWAVVSEKKDAAVWRKEVRMLLRKHKDCIAVACDCHI